MRLLVAIPSVRVSVFRQMDENEALNVLKQVAIPSVRVSVFRPAEEAAEAMDARFQFCRNPLGSGLGVSSVHGGRLTDTGRSPESQSPRFGSRCFVVVWTL